MKKIFNLKMVFAFVFLLFGGILLFLGIKVYKKTDYKPYNPKMSNKNYLINCIGDCSKVPKNYYNTFEVNDLSSDFKEVIEEYNKETNKLFEKHSKSDLSGVECVGKENKYKYRYNYDTDFYWGDTKDYISFTYRRIITDVCTDEVTVTEPETYIYSRDKKKLLSTKEFRKLEDISDDDISLSIKSSMVLIDYYAEHDKNDSNRNDISGSYLYDYHKQDYKYTKKDGKLYYKFFYLENELYMYYYQSDVKKYYQTVVNDYD